MRNTIRLFISLFLVTHNLTGIESDPLRGADSQKDTLLVLCTPSLTDIATKWAYEYSSQSERPHIKIQTAAEAVIAENLSEGNGLALVSGDFSPVSKESELNMVLAREIIVPVFNSQNPLFTEICRKGISVGKLAGILKDPVSANWSEVLKLDKNTPLNLYLSNDESVKSFLLEIEGTGSDENTSLKGVRVKNRSELISDIIKDPYAIGICNFSSILESGSIKGSDRVRLLPIDRNGNGQIDYMEDIYGDLTMFSRNVWIGKYPHIFYRNIYSLSTSQPYNDAEISFLKWILTDGQKYLGYYGYSELVLSEKTAKAGMLDNLGPGLVAQGGGSILSSLKPYAVSVLVITCLAILTVYLFLRSRKRVLESRVNTVPYSISGKDMLKIPLGLFYDKSHTWAYMERDGLVKTGVDDFLQHVTGRLTGVKMRNTGETLTKGEPFLTIVQNGKQLTLNSPVSGTIREQNNRLSADSSLINSSPFNEGWIYRIEPANWVKEIRFFIMGNIYTEWLKAEFARFKEFLGTLALRAELSDIRVLQDGGELKKGILENLGPESWEEFQINFIDVSA